jgi:hypothetical protein
MAFEALNTGADFAILGLYTPDMIRTLVGMLSIT